MSIGKTGANANGGVSDGAGRASLGAGQAQVPCHWPGRDGFVARSGKHTHPRCGNHDGGDGRLVRQHRGGALQVWM